MAADTNTSFVASIASRYGKRLQRFLTQRLQNRADAPDLVQEVYLRLLRVEQPGAIRSPEAYLLTVASHLLREHTLQQANVPPAVDIEELATELRGQPEDDPVFQAETQQRMRAVERALSKISPKALAALVLHRRDGYSLEEVGRQLGVSRSMAKKYLGMALAQCKRRLERIEKE